MTTLSNDELKTKYGVSDEEIARLEKEADAFDEGQWPAGKATRVGRPRSTEEPTKPVTFRIAVSKVDEVDRKAEDLGISRGAAIREAVDAWLAE